MAKIIPLHANAASSKKSTQRIISDPNLRGARPEPSWFYLGGLGDGAANDIMQFMVTGSRRSPAHETHAC